MLRDRARSAALLVPPVLLVLWLGGPWIALLVGVAVAVGAREAFRLLEAAGHPAFAALGVVLAIVIALADSVAAVPGGTGLLLAAMGIVLVGTAALTRQDPREGLASFATTTFGALYVGLLGFVPRLGTQAPLIPGDAPLEFLGPERGWILLLLLSVWTFDTGAYIAGRRFGRRKFMAHISPAKTVEGVVGGTEETTTGVIRLKAMAADGALGFPVVAVNEAQTKHLFDNRYGTGQSTVDGILRATNILLAGRRVVVAGYGWVGRGIASRMAGMGAHVAIVEVDPVRAIEALMDGFAVMTAGQAAPWGELFITATGNVNVFRREHFEAMRDGALLANSGHFDAEIDLRSLRQMAEGHVREVRDNVQEFDLGGRRLHLIAEGRLVNLGAAEGHPAAVMDMSFANQALSAEYVAAHHAELEDRVYVVPEAIDREVARLKLAALGITLDPLTPEQAEYVASWRHGT